MKVIIGGKAGAKIATELFDGDIKYVETYWDIKKKEQLFENYQDSVEFLKQENVDYFVATGDNEMRKSITSYLINKTNKKPINCIHKGATISSSAKIGHGNLICAGAVIFTDAQVGDGTIINTNSVIEHDCIIRDYSQISPGAIVCGYVDVGECSFVGAGSSIIPDIKIGKNSIVAAGSSVTKNISDRTLVAGCPAEVKKNDI